MNKLKAKAIKEAEQLLLQGRQPDFVKLMTGVTIIEMVRQGFLIELKFPLPDGRVAGTGQFRSVLGQPTKVTGISHKQAKRKDRKAFFRSRRAAVA